MDGDGGVLVEPQEHDPGQVEPGITTDEPAQEEEPQVPVESQAEGDEQVQQQAEPQAESLPEPSGPIEEHLAQQAPPPVVEEHKVPASAELEEVPPPPPAGVFEDENEAPPYMNDGTDDPTNAAWGKHPRSGIITKPDPLQTKTTPAAEESIRPDSARRRRKSARDLQMELVDREAVEDHQRKEPTVIDALELNAENKVQLDRLRDEAKSLGARQKTAEEQLKRTQLQLETRLSEQAHELAQSKKALQETLSKLQDYEKEFQQQTKTIETLNAEGAHNKEILEKKLGDIDTLRSQLDQVKAEIEQTKQTLQSQQASIEAAVNSGSRGCTTRACGQCSIL